MFYSVSFSSTHQPPLEYMSVGIVWPLVSYSAPGSAQPPLDACITYVSRSQLYNTTECISIRTNGGEDQADSTITVWLGIYLLDQSVSHCTSQGNDWCSGPNLLFPGQQCFVNFTCDRVLLIYPKTYPRKCYQIAGHLLCNSGEHHFVFLCPQTSLVLKWRVVWRKMLQALRRKPLQLSMNTTQNPHSNPLSGPGTWRGGRQVCVMMVAGVHNAGELGARECQGGKRGSKLANIRL